MTSTTISNPATETSTAAFVERRQAPTESSNPRSERRQFGSAHLGLSDEGRELAFAIDRYKVQHHRRYLTCDEMLAVLADLGYQKLAVSC